MVWCLRAQGTSVEGQVHNRLIVGAGNNPVSVYGKEQISRVTL